MIDVSVISIDMFQTLVDLESRKYPTWRIFLGDRFSRPLADSCWEMGAIELARQFHIVQNAGGSFLPLDKIFLACFKNIFSDKDIKFDPQSAARIFIRQHTLSKPFADVIPFLRSAGSSYPICLASDTDETMLGDLPSMYPFESFFTSEKLHAYKLDPDNRFFEAIVRHFNVPPARIIHIGDSVADIIGAKASGLIGCWLNRSRDRWQHPVKPDIEVASLDEISRLLGVMKECR